MLKQQCLEFVSKSSVLFCLLITPHGSVFEMTVKMKPSLIIFREKSRGLPTRRRKAHVTTFCLFKCDVRYSVEDDLRSALLSEICCIKTDPLNVSNDKLEMLYQKSALDSKRISYIFYVKMKNLHFFFFPDLAVTWGFCPNDTFLFVH